MSLGVYNTFTQDNLRYSQNAPLNMYDEVQKLSNPMWAASGQVPSNQANTEYAAMNSQYAAARDIDQAATTLDGGPKDDADDDRQQNGADDEPHEGYARHA